MFRTSREEIAASAAQRGNTRRGFTIIEILVASLLLVLILFSLGILIPLCQVRIKGTSHTDLAFFLAESMIARIGQIDIDRIPRNADFDGFKDAAVSGFPPSPYPRLAHDASGSEWGSQASNRHTVDYIYRVTTLPVTGPGGSPYQNLLSVTVSVYWEEAAKTGQSRMKCVSLSTRISSIRGEVP